jgi:hypothetical protein
VPIGARAATGPTGRGRGEVGQDLEMDPFGLDRRSWRAGDRVDPAEGEGEPDGEVTVLG